MHGKEKKDLMSAVSARPVSRTLCVGQVHALSRVLYRCAKQDREHQFHALVYQVARSDRAREAGSADCVCQPVNDVGEPCAGEPHARFDAAAGGNHGQSGQHGRAAARASRRPYNDPYVKLPGKWQVLARKSVVAADSSGARY